MIIGKNINGRDRVVIEFEKDIFISLWNHEKEGKVSVSFTDKTDDFKDKNGDLDLDKDYDTSKMSFESLDPDILLEFSDPKSIRNMILLLQDAEKTLSSKLPKRKSRKG